MNLPTVYHHPLPRQTLLPHLLPLLPYSLPIVRRIQFHFQSPHAVVLSTLSPTDEAPNHTLAQQEQGEKVLPRFAAAYTDRSRTPETETWVFSTIELPTSSTTPESLIFTKFQLLALFNHISTLTLPPPPHTPSDPSILLVGSIHARILALLKGVSVEDVVADGSGEKVISGDKALDHTHGSASPDNPGSGGVIRGHTVPYTKFIVPPYGAAQVQAFQRDSDFSHPNTGLTWGTVRPEDFQLVISRTDIPRRERTLELLPSLAIRKVSDELTSSEESENNSDSDDDDDDEEKTQLSEPIAWAFLGPDASLCSLHVEPAYRGRGFAKKLACQAFGFLLHDRHLLMNLPYDGMTRQQAWNHSDVSHDNAGSIGVAKAAGGRPGWECFWGWVDLNAVKREVEEREDM
ncbi:MAG: hypothetical protein MMC33_000392 [Icmadophila ericetorum]|nr:hypothetical protein [Icmadophila ericetorum]